MITMQLDEFLVYSHGLFLEIYIAFNYKIIKRKKCFSSMQSIIVIKPGLRVDLIIGSGLRSHGLIKVNPKK